MPDPTALEPGRVYLVPMVALDSMRLVPRSNFDPANPENVWYEQGRAIIDAEDWAGVVATDERVELGEPT